jgi:hypothetical protein
MRPDGTHEKKACILETLNSTATRGFAKEAELVNGYFHSHHHPQFPFSGVGSPLTISN